MIGSQHADTAYSKDTAADFDLNNLKGISTVLYIYTVPKRDTGN